MNQFTFDAKLRTGLIGFMILGLVCIVITFLVDDPLHTRFWSNYLHNAVFFTGIAFISLFTLAAFITSYAGWYTVMKRIWEAYSLFLIPGLALMLLVIIGIWGNFHHLYHWADREALLADKVLQAKSRFLNPYWYTFGTIIIVGAWIFFAWKIRQLSVMEGEQGNVDFKIHRKIRIWAAGYLPLAAFSSAAVIWLWIMSVEAHWFSTVFAWYTTTSLFVGAMALTVLTIIFLKGQGYYEQVTVDHLHDLGKYMFAFSIFWAYLWFSQYMLIWYGNLGEETVYFRQRLDDYRLLFYANLLLNFFLPFLVFMPNYTKRKYGTLVFTSIALLFGHWLDIFLQIKPGVYLTAQETLALRHGAEAVEQGASTVGHGPVEETMHQASQFAMGFTIPGFLEIGTALGFLALFMYFVFNRMAKVPLVPQSDPYIEESLHHHVEPPYSE
jgi:hypothetical protein